ncbi:hypothetical protein GWI33_006660 [Rhynchophorus ferrugineus]|uniref:CHK kinase-like domain-containing protein n=2 Tax=Rhynchophorus ferrugineus TaxID=354439 RepID=A0A834MDK0_RHYFE|nr:hypothetical protein GWI33_006660 [Rhynchophorus ferrugineus]
MAGSRSNIIDLPCILSKYYKNNTEIIEESIKQLNKPSSFELTATIKIEYSPEVKTVIYFMKIREHDTNINIRSLARFKNEVEIYGSVIPAITDFQISKRISPTRLYCNIFPSCIGARISIISYRTAPDDTGVLLLENLKGKGYVTPGAKEGLDLASCELVLIRMAHMHVAPLVMRHIRPRDFEEKVVPTLMTTQLEKNTYCNDYVCKLLSMTMKSKKIAKYIPSILMSIGKVLCNHCAGNPYEYCAWMTLCHSKLYNTNLMLAYHNSMPIGCKILNLKNFQYSHCCNDLLFFLFTSVDNEVLQEKFDYLTDYYFICFEDMVKEYKVHTSGYTKDEFHKEMAKQCPLTFIKILEALAEITCKKYDAKGNPVIGSRFQKKLEFVLDFMISRGWFGFVIDQS